MRKPQHANVNRRLFLGLAASATAGAACSAESNTLTPRRLARWRRFTSLSEHEAKLGTQKAAQELDGGFFPIARKRFILDPLGEPTGADSRSQNDHIDSAPLTWRLPPESVSCRFMTFVPRKPQPKVLHRWWLFTIHDQDAPRYRLRIYYHCSDSSLEHGSLALPLVSNIAARLGKQLTTLPSPQDEPEELLQVINREILAAIEILT